MIEGRPSTCYQGHQAEYLQKQCPLKIDTDKGEEEIVQNNKMEKEDGEKWKRRAGREKVK